MRLKNGIVLILALLAAPTPLLAQATGRGGVASSGLGASPAVGIGLASSSNAQPVGVNASSTAATAADAATGTTREVPGRFSPRKVCVYNVGVQLNGRSRAARINNDVDLRNVRMECR